MTSMARTASRGRLLAGAIAVPCLLGALGALVPDASALTGGRPTREKVLSGDRHIAGAVFLDANADRALDAGEAGVAGVSVLLMPRWGGRILAISHTGPDGVFRFDRLVPASYRITLQLGPGAGPTGDTSRIVDVRSRSSSGEYNFGIVAETER